ncbi:MAG: LytR C-terminal domain-containing protein [Longimicrobiales bacterium]
MKRPFQLFILSASSTAAVAFLVSFALGLRPRANSPIEVADPVRAVPGVFSGRRVEVFNAAGIPGLARSATESLRAGGYDVVYFGTLTRAQESRSIVLDRVGKPDIARAIAARLNIRRVETRIDSTRLVEVTVILAADWPALDSTVTRPPENRR